MNPIELVGVAVLVDQFVVEWQPVSSLVGVVPRDESLVVELEVP